MIRTALSPLIKSFNSITEETEIILESLYELEIDQHSLQGTLRRFNYKNREKAPVLHVVIDLFLYQDQKIPPEKQKINIFKPTLLFSPQEKELTLKDFESVTSPWQQSIMDDLLTERAADNQEIKKMEELLLGLQQNKSCIESSSFISFA